MRSLRRAVLVTLVLAVAFAAATGAGLAWLWQRFEAPGLLTAETAVVVPRGAGLARIAARLEQAGVIEQAWVFRLGARLTGRARRLKAGEYAFPAGISARGALAIIASGRTVVRRLTLPEGLTSREAVDLVRGAPGLRGGVERVPPEGSLLPETYHYSWGDGRAAMLERMAAAMAETLAALWPERADGLPFGTRREAVTLASIVEKETAVPEERALIAGVFVNRLDRGMRLQSDPTVAYGLTGGDGALGRALTREDLQLDHPYNTYLHAGLPPGPIANPGRAAIEAVLHPAETDYLYFVADGSGGHAFAETLREHTRNVAEWRRHRRDSAAEK